MGIDEMARALEAKIGLKSVFIADGARAVKEVYTGDLLSDVMGNSADEAILVTIQAQKNTVAVAVMKDSPAIIICNARPIPQDMLAAVQNEGISLFVTNANQFEVSGVLYALLKIDVA